MGFSFTLLSEGVKVGSAQHRGLPFFLPDSFLSSLCHLSLISSPWTCQNIKDLFVHLGFLFFFLHFLVRTQYLCTKCFHIYCLVRQLYKVFEVFRF